MTEPVSVVPLANEADLRTALKEAMFRTTPIIPALPPQEERSKPVILKYSRDRSYSAFVRGTSVWHVDDRDGVYKIYPQKKGQPRGWVPDKDRMVVFPPGTTADDVCDRLISMIQAAAGVA